MSPTSYQAAPPRVSALEPRRHKSEVQGLQRSGKINSRSFVAIAPRDDGKELLRSSGVTISARPLRCRIAIRVARRGEAIQELLGPAHHTKILARDALLQLGVALQSVAVATQGIDDARHRIDRRRHAQSIAPLVHEVERAVLAPLDREDQRGNDDAEPDQTRQHGASSHRFTFYKPYNAPPGNSAAAPNVSSMRRS